MAYASTQQHSGPKGYYAAMVLAASNIDAAPPAPSTSGGGAFGGGASSYTMHGALKRSPPNAPSLTPPTNTNNGYGAGSGALQPSPVMSPSASASYLRGGGANTSALSASFSSVASASASGGGGPRRYRHNPYGGSEPNTPTMHASAPTSQPPAAALGYGTAAGNAYGSAGHTDMNTSQDSVGSGSYAFGTGANGNSGNAFTNRYHARQHSSSYDGSQQHQQQPHGAGHRHSREMDSLEMQQQQQQQQQHQNNNSNGGNNNANGGSGSGPVIGIHHHQHTGGLDASSLGVIEQFTASLGALCQTACTLRGRHILVAVMRQQNERLQMIYDEIGPNIGLLSLDPQACHVVRSLLDYTTAEQNQQMVECLTDENVAEMASQSQPSRRILHCLFERLRSSALDGVVRVIARDAAAMAASQQGCITVMRAVEHGLPHQRLMLLEALAPSLAPLSMDPYANYVVQALIANVDPSVISRAVTGAYCGHWLALSCNKFGSNVVEKLVKSAFAAAGPARDAMLSELIFGDSTAVHTLVSDGFGNFVVQAIIDSAPTAEEAAALAERIRPALGASPYAPRIEGRLRGAAASGSASGAGARGQRAPTHGQRSGGHASERRSGNGTADASERGVGRPNNSKHNHSAASSRRQPHSASHSASVSTTQQHSGVSSAQPTSSSASSQGEAPIAPRHHQSRRR